MIADALKLSVYFGESVTAGTQLASDALMACLARHGLAAVSLVRGIEGFGLNRRIQTERFPDLSSDLPLLATAVDERDRIQAVLDEVDRAVPRGLVTLEHVRLASGADVRGAEFPEGRGRAAELTVYCRAGDRIGRRPAYREAVALLQRSGASGATMLRAVDGVLHGRRGRARLFSGNADTPLMIVSVGAAGPLRASLPALAELFAVPTVTLQRIAELKHDGRQLEPLPALTRRSPDDERWQAIRIYTRRNAEVDGRPLYVELTRRLRQAGASGATTVPGDWGFTADEPPHGDRFGRVSSHRPTYSIYVDRTEKVAQLWPLIDEITTVHGIVTSLLLPGYRERACTTARGAGGGEGA